MCINSIYIRLANDKAGVFCQTSHASNEELQVKVAISIKVLFANVVTDKLLDGYFLSFQKFIKSWINPSLPRA